ncbi:phosphate signaling complex protein PhoU [Lentibacillus juripiscarius]|uniref:Phosphate-specific transport system accessory protein PhoU n=1 Tax=Lentibacillus juripiscarius TaxID=257446 RepID=A0ABW5V452_9BACI
MAGREHFEADLSMVKKDIIDLAQTAEDALGKAVDALFNQDVMLAEKVIKQDREIDRRENEINEQTIVMMAKQQPVATDLRRLIISLKITTDVERMADHARNIAESALRLGEEHHLAIPQKVKEMRNMVMDMNHTAIQAFQYEDITIAGKLSAMDDAVDDLYESMIQNLLSETAANPEKIQYIMQMAFSARYMERFADHITNICESIIYLVKGESHKLN